MSLKAVVAELEDGQARLAGGNPLDPDAGTESAIRLLRHGDRSIYDIAVLVREGIYPIGTVHVGLYKAHIDRLIGKLRGKKI